MDIKNIRFHLFRHQVLQLYSLRAYSDLLKLPFDPSSHYLCPLGVKDKQNLQIEPWYRKKYLAQDFPVAAQKLVDKSTS